MSKAFFLIGYLKKQKTKTNSDLFSSYSLQYYKAKHLLPTIKIAKTGKSIIDKKQMKVQQLK